MIQFDPHTRDDWQARDIQQVAIILAQSGCEGTTLQIIENSIPPGYILFQDEPNPRIWINPIDRSLLQDTYITHTGSKWILKSDAILTRCGCGKSFGVKTGDTRLDKIKLLKSKLAKKTSHAS